MATTKKERKKNTFSCAIRMRYFADRAYTGSKTDQCCISTSHQTKCKWHNLLGHGNIPSSLTWRRSEENCSNWNGFICKYALLLTNYRAYNFTALHLQALINSVNRSSWIMDLVISEHLMCLCVWLFIRSAFVDWAFLNRFIFMWFHCLIIWTLFPFFIQMRVLDDECVNTDQVENWYKFNKNQVCMFNVHIVRYASPYLNANLLFPSFHLKFEWIWAYTFYAGMSINI